MKEFGLKFKEVESLTYEPYTADFFEQIVSELDVFERTSGERREKRIKLAYNYFANDFKYMMTGLSLWIKHDKLKVSQKNFAHFIDFVDKNMISSAAAKIVLSEMFNNGTDAEDIIKEKNLLQVSDGKDLEVFVQQAIKQNQTVVEEFKKGKENALQFLVGKCMALSNGKANPRVIQELLRKNLSK